MGFSSSPTSNKSSLIATFQNLVKPFIGAGILALPASFRKGGLVTSCLLMALLALMANYCIRRLLDCLYLIVGSTFIDDMEQEKIVNNQESRSNSIFRPSFFPRYSLANAPSYRDIGYIALGNVGKTLVDISLVLSQIGFCTAYMAFIGDNMHTVIPELSKQDWTLVLLACMAVLCQIRQVATLAWTSTAGNVVYLVCLILMFYDGFAHACCKTGSEISLVDLTGLPFVFGTACFALEGIGLILPVKAAMRPTDEHLFSPLLNVAIALVASVYILFATLGYLFYGADTVSNYTVNLSSDVGNIVRVSLCISLFFSYILQMYPVVLITDHICVKARGEKDGETIAEESAIRENELKADSTSPASTAPGTTKSKGYLLNDRERASDDLNTDLLSPDAAVDRPPEYDDAPFIPPISTGTYILQSFIRFLCVLLTAIIALFFPFALIVPFTGSLANSMIAFILPTIFWVILIGQKNPRVQEGNYLSLVIPFAVIIFGILASCVGVFYAVESEVEGNSS